MPPPLIPLPLHLYPYIFLIPVLFLQIYDDVLSFKGVQTRAQGIKVTGKIGFSTHYMIEHFKFLKSVAGDAVAKFTIPSPNMLYYRATIEEGVYNSDEELFDDLIVAYQGVIQALYEEGCRYLQIDDTSWATTFSPLSVS